MRSRGFLLTSHRPIMATIAILGTMDSKGEEHAFVAAQIRQRGHQVLVIDAGTLGEPTLKPDITRQQVAALNRIARKIFPRAGGAIWGMVEATPPKAEDKPIIVASQFGNTTACVDHARKILEAAGYEVLVFHATGTGGRTMESLIESGLVAGVLDITTTEWADELVRGFLSAGANRLEAAAKQGVRAIITPAAL